MTVMETKMNTPSISPKAKGFFKKPNPEEKLKRIGHIF